MNKPIIINIYTIVYSYSSLTFLKLPWLIESFKSSSTTRKGNLIELLTHSHSVMAAYIYIYIVVDRLAAVVVALVLVVVAVVAAALS